VSLAEKTVETEANIENQRIMYEKREEKSRGKVDGKAVQEGDVITCLRTCVVGNQPYSDVKTVSDNRTGKWVAQTQ